MPGVVIVESDNPVLVTGIDPDQPSLPVPPLAVHAVALVVFQRITSGADGCIVCALWLLAVIATVGAPGGAGLTVSGAFAIAEPGPGPVQVSV
jgi:hypothetical protein